jgi:hypothetical protein
MTWDDIDAGAHTTTPATTTPEPASVRRPGTLRRAILAAGVCGALLVAGGVAAVAAASPDPSSSGAPAATADPSNGGTTAPTQEREGRSGQPCPDKDRSGADGSGGSDDSSGSDGQSADPSPSTPTPAT